MKNTSNIGLLIHEALKKIYPQINGGYTFRIGEEDFDNALFWENQEYPKPTWEQIQKVLPIVELEEAKEKKLKELEDFHASDQVKILKIIVGNNTTQISLTQDYRNLIDEQIKLMELRKIMGESNPTWTYVNGINITLDYQTLVKIRIYIGALTEHNFKALKSNQKEINELTKIDQLKSFVVSKNYRINQILNF